MHYEIIATLGPASNQPEIWRSMVEAGVTGFRLNTSHMRLDELTEWVEQLDRFNAGCGYAPQIILDLQGSKWRLGEFNAFSMNEGDEIVFMLAENAAGGVCIPVPHTDFFTAVQQGANEISINDGKCQLKVQDWDENMVRAIVLVGGNVSRYKGITLQGEVSRMEKLSPKDEGIIQRTQGKKYYYAVSYVRDQDEMKRYRFLIGENEVLIAKLERRSALAEARQIAHVADSLWLCRGDLGAEMGIGAMAEAVHRFGKRVNEFERPVLMAGQIMEHMTGGLQPTRSEICYLYDCLKTGYAGVILSDETAVGINPLAACKAAALFLG